MKVEKIDSPFASVECPFFYDKPTVLLISEMEKTEQGVKTRVHLICGHRRGSDCKYRRRPDQKQDCEFKKQLKD